RRWAHALREYGHHREHHIELSARRSRRRGSERQRTRLFRWRRTRAPMVKKAAAGATISVRALNRAFLARQMLLERHKLSAVDAIERLVAMQAQVARPPFVGLWTRLHEFRRNELFDALHARSIVRVTSL